MTEEAIRLDLDRAQFDAGVHAETCASCRTPLHGIYYDASGTPVCESCAGWLSGTGGGDGGGLLRAVRATGAGTAAAFAGALVYWGILAATGYEFALISIGVGIAVGTAVRWGAEGRGGWRYQLLAVALTYLSIVCASVPMIVSAVQERRAAEAEVVTVSPAEAVTPPRPAEPAGAGEALTGLVMLVGFAAVLPVLGGFENIMGLLIIGFGLWQAWKLNRRPTAVVTGPHALTPTAPVATS